MNASVRARHDARGFSFVELLVTIVIAGIAFAAMVPVFVQGMQVSGRDKLRSVALNIAQDRIEKIRQLDFELVTSGNLATNGFYFGEINSTWTEQTEGGGTKEFEVTYSVDDKPVSGTDTRTAYKLVTVTVNWVGAPLPHTPAVLTTMIYRQYAGPQLATFSIADSDLGPTDPNHPTTSEKMITSPAVDMLAIVNSGDLDSMRPKFIGVAPNQHTVVGRVDFQVTSSSGAASPTIPVPLNTSAPSASFPATWNVPAITPGALDGYYTFKAVAFSALGAPGNSWILTYRVETGPPAAVTNPTGAAGTAMASLTWDASTTSDVDHYRIMRGSSIIADDVSKTGGMGYLDPYATTVDTETVYSILAVDWERNLSAPTTLTLTTTAVSDPRPSPATDLWNTTMGNVARLTWTPPVGAPAALGYIVYQTIGGATKTFVTGSTSATLDVTQPWNSTAIYQVKPYSAGYTLSAYWASIRSDQTTALGPDDTTAWLQVAVGAEPRYELDIKNTTGKTIDTLRLYYLGASGTDPQVEITPAATGLASNATANWTNLAGGKYRWDWPTNGNSDHVDSQTTTCSGAASIIYGSTP